MSKEKLEEIEFIKSLKWDGPILPEKKSPKRFSFFEHQWIYGYSPKELLRSATLILGRFAETDLQDFIQNRNKILEPINTSQSPNGMLSLTSVNTIALKVAALSELLKNYKEKVHGIEATGTYRSAKAILWTDSLLAQVSWTAGLSDELRINTRDSSTVESKTLCRVVKTVLTNKKLEDGIADEIMVVGYGMAYAMLCWSSLTRYTEIPQ